MGNFLLKWETFVHVFIDQNGYIQVLEGLRNTMIIAVFGLFIGIIGGTLIAIVKIVPQNNVFVKILSKVADGYVAFFRGTPMVVQLLLGYYVFLPLAGLRLSALTACVIIFGLNSTAYVSEIMRSGILSVDYGQTEAGRALGLSFPTTMLEIVVPQAVKNILPTLGNEFITLIKETSVVSFVTAVDLFTAFKNIGNANYEFMVPYLVMALIYIILIFIVTILIRLMEKRLRKSER